MAKADHEGLQRAARIIKDNQHEGRGQKGMVKKTFGRQGGMRDGNGGASGGIVRPTKPSAQHGI